MNESQVLATDNSNPSSKDIELLKAEMEWRKENERLRFYKPNGPCIQFLEKIGDGRITVGILSAANGIGKTTLAVNIIANLIWGVVGEEFNLPLFKNWRFPKRIRYISDPKMVEDTGPFQTEVKQWWPKGKYRSEKAGKMYLSLFKANDWMVDVMTYEQDERQFEGGTFGMIIFDEPPRQSIWNACISRLRRGGIVLVLMTPLTEAAWFFDQVVPQHEGNIVYAAIEDACKIHGKNGHLEHEHIEKMINEMPPEEIEARVYGKAIHLKGLIYKTYEERVHVLKESVKPNPNATVWQVVDPHSDKPFAVIWAMIDGKGDIYIVDEWPNEDFYRMHNCQLTLEDYKKIFGDKEQGFHVSKRIIDRHFAEVRSAINRKTLREELQEKCGLYYEPSYVAEEEIETGILKVRSFLQYDTSKPLSNLNQPKIFINPDCINTRKSFKNWSRDPKNGEVLDLYKDFMDVVRYLVMGNPTVDEPLPANQPKKLWG